MIKQAVMTLVRIGVTGIIRDGDAERLQEADWRMLYKTAARQGVACVCWHGIEVLHEAGNRICPKAVMLQWYARSQKTMTATRHLRDRVAAFARRMMPIRLAVLKGVHYACFWPDPLWREFGDLDCFALDGDTAAGDCRAAEIGCSVDAGDYKHSLICWNGLMVENHHFFTGFAGSSEGRVLETELRKLFDGGATPIGHTVLVSPNVNFTAVFLIAHAQNHFFYEGMGLRQILDWHFFLVKKGCEVDWDRVNAVLEKTGLMPFAVLLTCFCVRHFGLDASSAGVSFGLQTDEDMMEQFTDDLFAEQFDPNDRRWNMMARRMLHRYHRLVRFRRLNKMSVAAAVWRTIAFSSFMHRMPKLV